MGRQRGLQLDPLVLDWVLDHELAAMQGDTDRKRNGAAIFAIAQDWQIAAGELYAYLMLTPGEKLYFDEHGTRGGRSEPSVA